MGTEKEKERNSPSVSDGAKKIRKSPKSKDSQNKAKDTGAEPDAMIGLGDLDLAQTPSASPVNTPTVNEYPSVVDDVGKHFESEPDDEATASNAKASERKSVAKAYEVLKTIGAVDPVAQKINNKIFKMTCQMPPESDATNKQKIQPQTNQKSRIWSQK